MSGATSTASSDLLIAVRQLVLSVTPEAEPFDFTLQRGEHWLIRGPTRSGKTPFLKTLIGLMTPSAGEVHLLGHNVDATRPAALLELRRRLGVVFAIDGLLPAWNGFENLALPLRYHDALPDAEIMARIDAMAARYGIPQDWLENPVAGLSREKKSALALLRALLLQPEILIIDGVPLDAVEAFSGIRSTLLLEDALTGSGSVILSLPDDGAMQLPAYVNASVFRFARMSGGRLQCALPER